MTIETAVSRISYNGTASTATYPYTFKVFSKDDLVVKVKLLSTGVETTLTITTDYTVSDVGVAAGGNVTLVDASQAWLNGSGYLLSTYSITIERIVSIIQETSVTSQNSYLPEFAEKAYDKLTMIDQQQQRLIDNSLKLPSTETGNTTSTTLPAIATRANTILAFDSSGNPTTAVLSSVGANATASFVTISSEASLTNERILTGSANQILVTDNGPGSTVVVSAISPFTVSAVALDNIANGQTDYGPITGDVTQLTQASTLVLCLSSDASRTVKSILKNTGGLLYIFNNGSFNIILAHQYSSGTNAADRMIFAAAKDYTLPPNSGVLLIYDLTATRWRQVANGQSYIDPTQVAPATKPNSMTEYGARLIYAQTTAVTVANTASITTLLTTPAFGTATMAAGYLTAGKTLRVIAYGSYGITGTPTLLVGAGIATSGATGCVMTTASTSELWRYEAIITVKTPGATGTVNISTSFCGSTATGTQPFSGYRALSDNGPYDIASAAAVTLTATWGSADPSNTLTCMGVTIEVLG